MTSEVSDVKEALTKAGLKALARRIGQGEEEVRDMACPGLSVRVRKREAVWTLRSRLVGKQSTWRIGSITDAPLADPKEARRRAEEAKRLLARGIDPAEWLRAQENGGDVVRTGDPARDGWLWPEAVEAFLVDKARTRSPKTVVDYRKTLTAPAMRGKFDGRPLKGITAADLRAVIDPVAKAGKVAQANHILRVVKSLLSWSTQQGASGIVDTVPATVTVKPKEHRQARGHVPTIDELSNLFWRLDAAPLHPSIRLAAALLILTAQRRETVASARTADFLPYPDRSGWGMWRMEADPSLTLDRHHAVPLPPLAWGLVRLARHCAGASPWLFPQVRLRMAGDAGGGYISAKAIYDALKNAGGGELTPHDLRRALATHGPDHLRIRDDDTRKVLNHAHGRGDVTSRHYAFHDSMPWKVEVMERWEAWLVELARGAAPARTAWPAFLPEMGEAAAAPRLFLAAS